MTFARIRTAATERIITATTFYVSSQTKGGGEYVVKRFKTPNTISAYTVTCNCPDFNHRTQLAGLPCKHVHLVKMLAQCLGGWAKIKPSSDYDIEVRIANVLQRPVGTRSSQTKGA